MKRSSRPEWNRTTMQPINLSTGYQPEDIRAGFVARAGLEPAASGYGPDEMTYFSNAQYFLKISNCFSTNSLLYLPISFII